MVAQFLFVAGICSILFTTLFFYAACVVASDEPLDESPPDAVAESVPPPTDATPAEMA